MGEVSLHILDNVVHYFNRFLFIQFYLFYFQLLFSVFCLVLVLAASMLGRDRGEGGHTTLQMVEYVEGGGVASRIVDEDTEDEREDAVKL